MGSVVYSRMFNRVLFILFTYMVATGGGTPVTAQDTTGPEQPEPSTQRLTLATRSDQSGDGATQRESSRTVPALQQQLAQLGDDNASKLSRLNEADPEASVVPAFVTQASETGDPSSTEVAEPIAPSEPESEADDPAAASEDDRGLLRLTLIGSAIVALGALGGTVLLLARRGTVLPDGAESSPDDQGPPQGSGEPLESPPSAKLERNGRTQSSTSLPVASGAVEVEPPTLSTQSFSPRKLAKVDIIDELIQDLDDPSPTTRRKAIWELGQRANSKAVRPLVGLLANADSREQSLILAALAEIGTQTLKPMNRALAISLQDENPEVRKNAIRDLARVYDVMGQAGKMLGHAASDDDPDVRQTAHWALDQLNHMRLTATETAGFLPQAKPAVESLPESTTTKAPFSDENALIEPLPAESYGEDSTAMKSYPEDESSFPTV